MHIEFPFRRSALFIVALVISLQSPAYSDTDKKTVAKTVQSKATASSEEETRMKSDHSKGSVVNWNPPTKRAIVERAISDGMTNSEKIVEWAKNYKVKMTIKEVDDIMSQLKQKN